MMMDILVGNTCVMIDRDPNEVERRKVYGRAGEFRTPKHGLEYRTLSNFWLRSYQLMSLVMGLSRLATSVLGTTLYMPTSDGYTGYPMTPFDAEAKLLSLVDKDAIREAINNNDLDLAKKNWVGVKKFFLDHTHHNESGLNANGVKPFEFFLKKIEEKGIEFWFPTDPMTHWCTLREGHGIGWESFLTGAITTKMHSEPKVVEVP